MPLNDGAAMNSSDILTPLQQKTLAHLFADKWFLRHFYLTGGTALSAFHLFHRYSDDLDFFSHGIELTPINGLMRNIAKKMGAKVEQVQTSPGFMRYTVADEVKLDFVSDIEFRVGSPELVEGFMVDCIKNIAVNKVGTILGRLDTKDYIDLYFLLKDKTFDIFELLTLAKNKDGGMDPFIWASLIADVDKLRIIPRMIKPISLAELTKFFLELRDKILDRINPKKQKK